MRLNPILVHLIIINHYQSVQATTLQGLSQVTHLWLLKLKFHENVVSETIANTNKNKSVKDVNRISEFLRELMRKINEEY